MLEGRTFVLDREHLQGDLSKILILRPPPEQPDLCYMGVVTTVTGLCVCVQCLDFGEGSVTGDLCEDLCVLHLVEYKRCLYYENGKKVMEARWRGEPVILKSKLENFSSYEPLGILDYQVFISTVWILTVTANKHPVVLVVVVVFRSRKQQSSSPLWRWSSTPPWK